MWTTFLSAMTMAGEMTTGPIHVQAGTPLTAHHFVMGGQRSFHGLSRKAAPKVERAHVAYDGSLAEGETERTTWTPREDTRSLLRY